MCLSQACGQIRQPCNLSPIRSAHITELSDDAEETDHREGSAGNVFC